MSKRTKILIVDNDPDDVKLVERELLKSEIHFVSKAVENEKEYRDALQDFTPDIILCDYSFPSFNGTAAFRIKEELAPEVPFIIVSGTIGEERAVELIKRGGSDCVLKDKLYALPQKINRALEDAEEKKEKINVYEKLKKANRLYSFISQINQGIIYIDDEQKLLENACEIAVNIGQFKIAWIGLLDKSNKLKMVCLRGSEVAIKKVLRYEEIDNGSILKETLVGEALTTGRYSLCNDVQNEPALKPWREEFILQKIQATISLPIKKQGKVAGVFSLDSGTKGFFDEEEITMLDRVAVDISFGLDMFEKTRKHKDMEDLLEQNEKLIQQNDELRRQMRN